MAEGGGPAHREGQQPPPQVIQQQQLHMNWLHFKPEFLLVNQMKMWKCIY